ncbi:hypothetical protein BDP55DRAFT_655668 [Colletotrichum godetiae]|uniref:Ribonuclease H1 N-terminal domain-containing protein n=1 Tax=Colletotrichum godetiae TaxID=1209918 RepID=A0AAJ0ARC0_9PEZI|nr:uncharacterized protein BDP55DRAFT_655668 [Colletotrichum godetiae]KAK1688953.1 hypothetical protein BDP55DRAFT_655668 [Colletotrichum godetiae]
MTLRMTKATEFYAVYKGRVDEPTITRLGINSGGAAHPRVTGCSAVFKGFRYAGPQMAKTPGIYQYWRGQTQALSQLHEAPGACCKKFKTKEQAEEFIEEWKQAVADVLLRSIREALDQGMRPKDMSLDVSDLFDWNQNGTESHDEVNGLDFEALRIQDTQTEQQ